jgi:hypothetical protein
MRCSVLIPIVLLATACVPTPGADFSTTSGKVYSLAKPGTVMTAATLQGKVYADTKAYPNLSVAAVSVGKMLGSADEQTLAIARVSNGAYSLALPQLSFLEDKDPTKVRSYAYHELWVLVLFNDRNGNGKYDDNMPASKADERDTPIATVESYRLGYKGYVSDEKSYAFLPHNSFAQGWILVVKRAIETTQYHQDFTKTFDLTESNF